MSGRVRSQGPARWTISALVLTCSVISARQPSPLRESVDSYVSSHQRAIVDELVQLLSIPNVAADRAHIRQNAVLLRSLLERRGMRAEVLETAGNPLVFGELAVQGATTTVLFYVHYDGQPVEPRAWLQANPFTPILRA